MVEIIALDGFGDPRIDSARWNDLLAQADSREVFLTFEYQRAWWESFGRDRQLLLLLAHGDGRDLALAPLFVDGDTAYLVGSGGSDYLDLIGDVGDFAVLEAVLRTAATAQPALQRFVFYHVDQNSRTGPCLRAAAARLGWRCRSELGLAAPAIDLAADPDHARAVARKKSLLRHEATMARQGTLALQPLERPDDIAANLELLFEQHVARWAATPFASLFLDPRQRDFYRRLAEAGRGAGWLRFTRLDWQGRAVALHFGFEFERRLLWYKPSFDIGLARMSPGEVLLRRLLLDAIDRGVRCFDFGLGDEQFKQRFANASRSVDNWTISRP